jgi:RNA polymerase sigma-70 factor (ECF subfamily)
MLPPSFAAQEDIRERYVIQAFGHEPKIRAQLYRMTRNVADTEELLQEVYMRLLTMDEQHLRKVKCVLAFVLTMARNIVRDWVRHRKVVSITLIADLESDLAGGEQPDDLFPIDQELEALADIVESMPFKRRQVFTLRKVYGLSQKEIARKLSISENTVEQHLTKAARNIAYVFKHRAHASNVLPHTKAVGVRSRRRTPISVRTITTAARRLPLALPTPYGAPHTPISQAPPP